MYFSRFLHGQLTNTDQRQDLEENDSNPEVSPSPNTDLTIVKMMSSSTATVQQAKEAMEKSLKESADLVHFEPRVYGDWRDEFHQNGCVVIKNVISPEKAKTYCDRQIQWLKSFDLGFDEKDPSTWTAEHLPVSFKGG